MNHGCVNKLGEVEDFKHFVISDGSLLLPPDMTMTRQDNVITLAWNDERNATSARPSDIIHVMVIGTTRPDALMLLHGTSATRAEGTASFTVQAKENETLHVYPFLATRRTRHSPRTSISSLPPRSTSQRKLPLPINFIPLRRDKK